MHIVFTKCVFIDVTRVVVDDFAVNNVSQMMIHVHGNRVGHTNEQVHEETSFSAAASCQQHTACNADGQTRQGCLDDQSKKQ